MGFVKKGRNRLKHFLWKRTKFALGKSLWIWGIVSKALPYIAKFAGNKYPKLEKAMSNPLWGLPFVIFVIWFLRKFIFYPKILRKKHQKEIASQKQKIRNFFRSNDVENLQQIDSKKKKILVHLVERERKKLYDLAEEKHFHKFIVRYEHSGHFNASKRKDGDKGATVGFYIYLTDLLRE